MITLHRESALLLVSCPGNSMHFAGGQLAVFQGANERPYLTHTGRVSNAEKQPTGHGPTGCDENGPAAALLVGHVSIQICSLPPPVRLGPPCRRPILIATKYMLFRGQDTRVHSAGELTVRCAHYQFSSNAPSLTRCW